MYKCHFCPVCNGRGCRGEMPGMGGPMDSINFKNNCDDWKDLPKAADISSIKIRLAPITGAVENVGWEDEDSFYSALIKFCYEKDVELSIGDGTPDCKLLNGIEAVKKLNGPKAAVFIKPYPDDRLYERLEWAQDIAEYAGIDIDSYNIVTMRNLVHLEQKTPSQLMALKKHLSAKGIPLVIKGIFTQHDIDMAKEVKPDVIYISNHGGRVETRKGSTASFLQKHARDLASYCDQIWIDGGIRTRGDIASAAYYGVSTVLAGRPFITALCGGTETLTQ